MPGTLNVGGHNIITHSGTSGAGTVDADNIDTVNIGNNALVVDSSGNVGIGTSSPNNKVHIYSNTDNSAVSPNSDDSGLTIANYSTATNSYSCILLRTHDGTDSIYQRAISAANNDISFEIGGQNSGASTPSPFLTIDSSGDVSVGKTATNFANAGVDLYSWGRGDFTVSGATPLRINRLTNDGFLIDLNQNSTSEGRISVSGATISYVGFTGTHWSRLLDGSTPDIPRGTILESLDEMMDWVKEDGTLEDDIKHVKCKISDTVESKNVYGLFYGWDNEDDYNDLLVSQVGSFVIRIHSSQDVQRGDLIQSNGDGTGKIQADDIIRSSTVAKVISNHRVETYEDGSYIVPCVIHC